MKFVRYQRGGGAQWGVRVEDTVYGLSGLPEGEPALDELSNPAVRRRIEQRIDAGTLPSVDADEADFLAPVPKPGKIVCVGLNYHDHAEEGGDEPPENPLLFAKAPTTVTNPGDPIVHPGDGQEVDYEVELAVVIGTEAKGVTAEEASEYVAGYTALNDVSGRTAQFDDGQFFRGKSFDTFSPMGPAIVADESFDPNGVDVETRLNGKTVQESNTEEFIFDVWETIEYITQSMTLRPGDVISTGTPAGVGIFRDPPELLEPGDEVEIEIEGIGTLRNPVVGE